MDHKEQDTIPHSLQECLHSQMVQMRQKDHLQRQDRKTNGKAESLRVLFRNRLEERNWVLLIQVLRNCLEVIELIWITDQMQCLYLPPKRRPSNGNQLDNKRLLKRENLRSYTEEVLQFMEPTRRKMEHLWPIMQTGETYSKLILTHHHLKKIQIWVLH